MIEREDNLLPQDKDRHLDIPSEANTDKHINFLDLEANDEQDTNSNRKDEATEERQKQWKQGIEEGKRANRE